MAATSTQLVATKPRTVHCWTYQYVRENTKAATLHLMSEVTEGGHRNALCCFQSPWCTSPSAWHGSAFAHCFHVLA